MADDLSGMKIQELIAYAEKRFAEEKEAQCPDRSLLGQDDTSWESTLEILRVMQQRGVPDSLK
jgi:hypothetical protein